MTESDVIRRSALIRAKESDGAKDIPAEIEGIITVPLTPDNFVDIWNNYLLPNERYYSPKHPFEGIGMRALTYRNRILYMSMQADKLDDPTEILGGVTEGKGK